jgi:hypothetical protein
MKSSAPAKSRKAKSESGQVPIRKLAVHTLTPSRENDDIYRPFDASDPANRALMESIRKHGVREPLIVSEDRHIISGHRRYAAAKSAGRKRIACIVEPIRWDKTEPGEWIKLLARHNVNQRVKTFDEQLREQIATVTDDDAYADLLAEREDRSRLNGHTADLSAINIGRRRARAAISEAKIPMLQAVMSILDAHRDIWPLSLRYVHYRLLNDPPLIHASKSGSKYSNDRKSSKSLSDLVTRARIEDLIPWDAIHDPTRPVTVWDVHREPSTFIRQELDEVFTGYWRDLMQSQPHHIEIVGEKNTLDSIVRTVASEYTIPYTLGRGFSSYPPRKAMAQRFRRSGKDRLVLIIISDFDPEGESIAESFARSMRDDCHISNVAAFKAGITARQVEEYGLPPTIQAKKTSSRYAGFVAEHGENVYEVEALEVDDLQAAIRDSIEAVIDRDAYEHERDAEKADARHLKGVRQIVRESLAGMDFMQDEGGDDE